MSDKMNKMQVAINLINQNPTMTEDKIGQLIADTLGIKLGNAIHNYYKAPIRKGLCDIKSRVLSGNKKPRTRKAKVKVVAETPKITVDTTKASAPVVTVKPRPKFTQNQIDSFKQGLARAQARKEAADAEMEMPEFLRRA